MPTITQLEYVIAVERHRHFAKAAEACHISQPTLSQQIAKLEDEVGIIIFDRIKKPIVLTPEGAIFVEQAKIVLREHQRLIHIAKKNQQGIEGEFRLAIIPTVGSYLLPLFIETFAERYPAIDLYIEEMKTEGIVQALRQDQLDGAILATPLPEEGLKQHLLYYEPLHLYLSPRHRLKNKLRVSASELEEQEIWMLQDGNCFKTQVAQYCSVNAHADRVLKNVHFQSGSLDTLRHLIRRSKGATLIPALMAIYLDKKEIEESVKPFKGQVPTREISFIYRRDHWKLAMIRAIEETIKANLPQVVYAERQANMNVLEIC